MENRINADYNAIAKGIYAMLEDMANKGDESYLTALAFGMLPGPLMEMVEKQTIEKLAKPYIDRWGVPKNRAIQAVKEDYKTELSDFMRLLSVEILHVAKENCNLVV